MRHIRKIMNQQSRLALASLALATAFQGLGCDDEGPTRESEAVQDVETVHHTPPKALLDILLVIDDSPSMCEEHVNLTKNLVSMGQSLLDNQSHRYDIRIAVVSADAANPAEAGRFLYRPAPPVVPANCPVGPAFDTADCPASADPILRVDKVFEDCPAGDRDCLSTAMELGLRCRATLGLGGSGHEAGLEASRRALSCDGPNAAALGACCKDGQRVPDCDIPRHEPQPAFLRPGAVLEVVYISDEDDCSTANLRPPTTPEGLADHPGPGAEAFGQSLCEWQQDQLEPVSNYVDFLKSLKASPREQLVVAAITGKRAYTDSGDSIRYTSEPTPAQVVCLDETGAYNPGRPCATNTDCPGTGNACQPDENAGGQSFCTGEGAEAACCPEGHCVGAVLTSCESEGAVSNTGLRYLELAEIFDRDLSAGVGCPPGSEDDPSVCANICTDDFASDFNNFAIIDEIVGVYCLEARPLCEVRTAEGVRPCATDSEHRDPGSYQIQVSARCHEPPTQDGGCDPRAIADLSQPNAWIFEPADPTARPEDSCPLITLAERPQQDSEVIISYRTYTSPQ